LQNFSDWSLVMKADVRRLEAFECGYGGEWKELVGWTKFQMKKCWQKWRRTDRQHHWIGHILTHESLLLDISEGGMKGRPTRGRRRL